MAKQKEELPMLRTFGVHRTPDGWVWLTVESRGERVVAAEASEPQRDPLPVILDALRAFKRYARELMGLESVQ